VLNILSDLEKVKGEKFIYLTTTGRKTGKPHTVELWFAISDNRIFLSHEGAMTDWMKNIQKKGDVNVKIGNIKLAGRASFTPDKGASREMGKKALYEKYYGPASREVLDDWFELSKVIEILPAN
jgi:deazaflavin-dependent oxidoreductase (nitroreductase family)